MTNRSSFSPRTRPINWRAFNLILIFVLLVGQAAVIPAQAKPQVDLPSIITVNTLVLANDEFDGSCDLWEALKASFDQKSSGDGKYHECDEDGAGPTVIVFAPNILGGKIQLPATGGYPELPMINDNVSIAGPITIDGGGKPADLHIFKIASGGTLNLAAMSLTNAYTSGSGSVILNMNGGSINMVGVLVTGNTAESDGGAIDTNGSVNIIGGAFSGNRALGIYSDGSDNTATGYGGAINMYGSDDLMIMGVAFNGNIADKGAGAIYFSGGEAEIKQTTFNGNLVQDLPVTTITDTLKGGGAVINDPDSKMEISTVAFDGNLSFAGHGGALYNGINGQLIVKDSSFNANLAGDLDHDKMGGAIYNAGVITMTRSALLANISSDGGGGLAVDRSGDAKLANVTFAGNTTIGDGGALWNGNTQQGGPASTIIGNYLTFSDNNAASGSIVYQESSSHPVSLGSSILNQGIGLMDNCSDPITSLGHNIDSGNSCGFNQTGDLVNTNPQLKGLDFNGGPILSLLSMGLENTSPAVDAGDPNQCTHKLIENQDQRGEARPKDGDANGSEICDIGAFENDVLKAGYGSNPVQPGPVNLGAATFGNPTNGSFSIFETGNYTLTISSAALSGGAASQFSIVTSTPLNILDGDPAVDFDLSCTPTGPTEGQITTTLTLQTNDPDNASVDYTLTCSGYMAPTPGFGADVTPPGPLDFGPVLVGDIKGYTLAAEETGTAMLTLSNPTLGGSNPGDFAIVSSFPITIPNGNAPANIDLRCVPTEPGIRTATFSFETDDPNNLTVTYNLSCKGITPPPPVLEDPGTSYDGQGIILTNPYGIAVSPDGKYIYAMGETSDSISVYERDMTTGALVNTQAVGDMDGYLDGARMMTISPDGLTAYVSGYIADTLVVYSRDPATGDLARIDYVQNGASYGCDPMPCDGTISELDGAYQTAISPDGRFLYASGVTSDAILVLSRGVTGTLTTPAGGVNFVQSYTNPGDLNAAYGIALSPDGANLYATGYQSDTVLVFQRSAVDGTLTYQQTLAAVADGIPSLNGVFRVTVSPDGRNVYTASYDSDSLTAFERNPLDGTLTYLTGYTNGVDGVSGLDAATSVKVSPDGNYVFATGYNSDAVAAFQRDPDSGLLFFAQAVVRDIITGLPALDGARDLIVSPDGRLVAATGRLDNRVVVLRRANPVPVLSSLLPASVVEGSPTLTMTVKGSDFVLGAVARWNGVDLSTTFVNDTELQAVVPDTYLVAAGTETVDVVNPEPSGGVSYNTLDFTITPPAENPVPSIDFLAPQGAQSGDPGFTLNVYGVNFLPTSVVQWNGSDRPTTFISATELQAAIDAADIAQPGSFGVSVFNPMPGGGSSNAALFDVAAPGENPLPSLSSLEPQEITSQGAGTPPINLVIHGLNFVDGAKVFWNGAERPTTFVSSSEVHAAISGGDLVVAGTVGVSVSNPAPGGGESNTLTFLIHPEILLTDAEIAVSKSGPAEAVAGENFVYTLTASNSGPLIATNVIFTDTLPANVSFVSADDPDCLANGSVVACKMGKVVIGGSKSVNITVHADTAGTANNSTFATLNQHDPDPSNNTSATVVTNILPAEADLSISMSAPAGAAPGSQFDYTIVIGNDGPVDATNVTLTDVLPAGVSYVSSNFPGAGPTASCTEASGTVTCALGALLKNTTITVTITVQVNTLGELSNTASVTADQPDPNPANNTSAPVIVIGLRTTYLPLAVRQP